MTDAAIVALAAVQVLAGHARRRRSVARLLFIVYRRLTMNGVTGSLDRATAAEYASWFKALANPTRIQVVTLLARRATPLNVSQIVAEVDVGQSTVSAHLRVLARVGFVLVEHRGTASYYRINEACVQCFPTAADVVMGRPSALAPSPPGPTRQ
jgi:DNA-binding transcriptional ArsR family regulator